MDATEQGKGHNRLLGENKKEVWLSLRCCLIGGKSACGARQMGSTLPLLLFQLPHSHRNSVNPTVNPIFDGCIWIQSIALGVTRISVDDMVSTPVKCQPNTRTPFSELACIYSALILLQDEVTVTWRIRAMPSLKAGVSVELFGPGLFAKAPANVNIGSPICNVGAGGPAPAAGTGPLPPPPQHSCPSRGGGGSKEESEESDDDMGFGLSN
ncbi:uncharacterized protein LOC110577213 [Neomonachus schauinslandi]|uniref:Uncharacterized protein LOC110577213 n=1 Tax=Neomonachus schauinslandi TaxID=29088 RepID=A0A8M1MPE3_NEOSC|nr:uncharacterized protein LOC110577213 [Neomonachus schauinslandi]